MKRKDMGKYYEQFEKDLRLKSAYGVPEEEHIRRIIMNDIPRQDNTMMLKVSGKNNRRIDNV